MSHPSSRGASYLVRRLKGKSAVHFAAPGGGGGSSKNAASFSTGTRLAFFDQTAYSNGGTTSSGPANVAGTVVEWPSASAGSSSESAIAGGHSHKQQYTGHRANHRQHSGNGHAGAASLLPSFWIQPPASSTTSPSLFAGTTSSSSKSFAASSSAASSSSHTSSPPASSSVQAKEQGIRIPPRSTSTQSTQLTLHHGAFGIPKRPKVKSVKGKEREEPDPEDPTQKQIQELEGPLLSVQVGEDAYFVRHDSLGVADGVGGWSGRKGADPGLFATRLMHHCSAGLALGEQQLQRPSSSSSSQSSSSSSSRLSFVSSSTSSAGNPNSTANMHTSTTEDGASTRTKPAKGGYAAEGDPIEILHQAWDLTLTEFFDLELIGSTTALIALLKDDELRLANLGDCSCSIIRGSEYIFRSQEQQHSFNYPFQMGTNSQDTPRKDGQRFTIKVQKNDIVILASDGLVDNLFDEDILEEVEKFTVSPQQLSQALCARAKAVSEDQSAVTSPFQQRANEEGIHFVGGKHDDISVLVAVIGDAAQESM